jgi:hypothetical protein
VLTDGPGKDCFLYYSTPTFDALVDNNGAITFKLKDKDGEYVGQAVTPCGGIATSWTKPIGYNSRGELMTRGIGRYMIEITEAPRPTDKPSGTVTIKAKLMDKVDFVRVFKFQGDTVDIYTGFRCRNADYPSHTYGYGVSMAACMSFAPQVEQVDREAALKDYQIVIDGKKKATYLYSDNKTFSGATTYDATGPWGPRHLIFKTPGPTIHCGLYSGMCLYQGYSLSLTSVPNDSLGKQGRLTVTIK